MTMKVRAYCCSCCYVLHRGMGGWVISFFHACCHCLISFVDVERIWMCMKVAPMLKANIISNSKIDNSLCCLQIGCVHVKKILMLVFLSISYMQTLLLLQQHRTLAVDHPTWKKVPTIVVSDSLLGDESSFAKRNVGQWESTQEYIFKQTCPPSRIPPSLICTYIDIVCARTRTGAPYSWWHHTYNWWYNQPQHYTIPTTNSRPDFNQCIPSQNACKAGWRLH